MLKVTFKKWDKLTGLAAIGYGKRSVDIKIDKKLVGTIDAPNWQSEDSTWGISFMVMKTEPDDNPNSDWKNIRLRAKFASENDAREFIKNNIDRIAEKYTLHYEEEYK
jgi:hypothetical protein